MMKDRFGGLYSSLNRRDIQYIRNFEEDIIENTPEGMGYSSEELEYEILVGGKDRLSEVMHSMSIDDIIDELQGILRYLKQYIDGRLYGERLGDPDANRQIRLIRSEGLGVIRSYYEGLSKILRKLLYTKRKFESEELPS